MVVYKTSQTEFVTLNVDGAAGMTYTVEWYNPRTGGALTTATPVLIDGSEPVSFDAPLGEADLDWVLLLKSTTQQRLRRTL